MIFQHSRKKKDHKELVVERVDNRSSTRVAGRGGSKKKRVKGSRKKGGGLGESDERRGKRKAPWEAFESAKLPLRREEQSKKGGRKRKKRRANNS